MVKHQSYADNPDQWVAQVVQLRGEKDVSSLQSAIKFYPNKQVSELEKGLGIADILLSLGLDTETITAALIYPGLQTEIVHLDAITDHFSEAIRKLLQDVLQMQSLGKLQHLQKRGHHHIENLRKMLLAMVTDVRAVLVVLAERLWELRQVKHSNAAEQQSLAQETMDVYSPLANRLGVWQLKWEMEDLCLRYLQPEAYSKIAKSLASRRQEREEYIKRVIAILSHMLNDAQIKNFQVTGRVKHIYSIYRKMTRKGSSLSEIYDISALRVLVQDISDCYTVLGILQNTWPQIPEEFDDYISQPKANGYRSIHIVVKGPEDHYNEVQIRTYQMHQESELGVAAHWRYKEGVLQPSSYEAKIALLRQIMAWQKEVVSSHEVKTEQPIEDLLSDRVYVFTPLGDIVDLPKGATPLDFAYHIHSELGHRCRGAKINGSIVQLTHTLQTGERIEILTAKVPNPSRDWLNPHYGYLKTPRARAKAQHWFRVRDSMQTSAQEREHTEKETNMHHAPPITNAPIISHAHTAARESSIQILGINNLLTKMARCCKPLPGDPIVGYITQNRGVSVHRSDCNNLRHMVSQNQVRLIEVSWGEKFEAKYPVDLQLRMYDRAGLLRDITTFLAGEKINVLGVQTTQAGAQVPEGVIYMTIEISSMQELKKAIDHLKKIPNIIEVRRR